MNKTNPITAFLRKFFLYSFYPTGVVKIWRSRLHPLLRLAYTLIWLPVFISVTAFFAIVIFGACLPPVDMSMANRRDRTVYFSEGHYQSTFVKNGFDTHGSYELVEVELEPHGGNDWHYHKGFQEDFTVLEGVAEIGQGDNIVTLQKGEHASATRGKMHFFRNPTDSTIRLLVKVQPAGGLEKSVRVVYGLANDGKFDGEITANPWHMPLLLAYSNTYLPEIPAFVQEPLVTALAKIAQWKGEDKELEKYFR